MKAKLLFVILVSLLLATCGKVPETHYFTLEWQQLAKPATSDAVLFVQRFDAVPMLKNDQMMYKTSPYEIKYDNYRRWVMSPSLLLSHKTAEYLSTSGLFDHVVVDVPRASATHSLFGHVTHFEDIDFGGRHHVRITVTFELKDIQEDKVLFNTTLSQEADVSENSAEGIVVAMSAATRQMLDDLSREIQNVLK